MQPLCNTDGVIGADQGAGASTIDPMGAVQKALRSSRKMFGLPENIFQSNETASFGDGGVVLLSASSAGLRWGFADLGLPNEALSCLEQ